MAGDDKDEGFLARWSRLKTAPASPPQAEAAADPKTGQPPAVAKPEPAGKAEGKGKVEPAELPSIDSLTGDSDFSVFLREGVPDALRRQALRKLWVSDPVIAATDVFDVYNLDYFNMPSFPEGVKTLFRAGHGMLDEVELEAEKEAARQAKEQGRPTGESAGEAPPAPEISPPADTIDAATQHASGEPLPEKPGKSTDG